VLLLPKGTALAWITADEYDDLHRFLRCLFLALEPYDLPWRTDPMALIAAATDTQPDLDAAVTGLVNAMAGCEVPRGLVVVDDAHLVGDAAVFSFLQLLLDRLPAHWGLVLSTRVEPPLKLARCAPGMNWPSFARTTCRFTAAGGRRRWWLAAATAAMRRSSGRVPGVGRLACAWR
jgi:LuxR family transcriptional regulator, maltose regulon positive regulatory protein